VRPSAVAAVGRRQVSDLALDLAKAPLKDVAITIGMELVVSERFVDVVEKERPTGVSFRPIERARGVSLDRLITLLACGVLLAQVVACSAVPNPSLTAQTSETSDIRAIDARLLPPLLAIAEHPDWAPGSTSQLDAHLALTSGDELCVEVLRPNLLPLYVTVDTDAQPWTVKSIVVFDPATDASPQVTYENGDPDADPDTCRMVLGGSGEPFPHDPGSIEVVGGVGPEHALLIARTLVSLPEAFGIDRSSLPSLNVRPVEDGGEDRACYDATVFQGRPRTTVRITLLRDGDEWRFHHVRVTNPRPPAGQFMPEGAC
jgi:hypothetical protein